MTPPVYARVLIHIFRTVWLWRSLSIQGAKTSNQEFLIWYAVPKQTPDRVHPDLRLQNIMANDGSVNGVLDWEFSRWYPEYWEFSKALYVWKVAEWLDWLPSTDPSTLLCWICGSFILDWNLVVIFIYLRSCTLPHAPVSFPGIRIDCIVPNMTRIYGETVWGGLVDHFGHYPNLIKRWIGRFRRSIYGVHIVLWIKVYRSEQISSLAVRTELCLRMPWIRRNSRVCRWSDHQ